MQNPSIKLDTKISELDLPAKLVTRLRICKARSFADIMKIDHADWTDVTPKVVNALKRFQTEYVRTYSKLLEEANSASDTGAVEEEIAESEATSPTPQSANDDERRFFVANNLLNAYASAGRINASDSNIQGIMAEIMLITDEFLKAYNGETPIRDTPKISETNAPEPPQATTPSPKKERRSRNRRKTADDPIEIPAAEEIPPAEEPKVEEIPAEAPVAEEIPAVEQPIVEETPAEAPVAEEIPAVEQPIVEETPAEVPVAEEIPAAEQPIVEVTPAEVPAAEEIPAAEQPIVEVTPAEVPAAEEIPVFEPKFEYEAPVPFLTLDNGEIISQEEIMEAMADIDDVNTDEYIEDPIDIESLDEVLFIDRDTTPKEPEIPQAAEDEPEISEDEHEIPEADEEAAPEEPEILQAAEDVPQIAEDEPEIPQTAEEETEIPEAAPEETPVTPEVEPEIPVQTPSQPSAPASLFPEFDQTPALFNFDDETPADTPIAEHDDSQATELPPHVNPEVKAGQTIRLLNYHGTTRRSLSKYYKIGDLITVDGMKEGKNGVMQVRAIINSRPVYFDADHWDWEIAEE